MHVIWVIKRNTYIKWGKFRRNYLDRAQAVKLDSGQWRRSSVSRHQFWNLCWKETAIQDYFSVLRFSPAIIHPQILLAHPSTVSPDVCGRRLNRHKDLLSVLNWGFSCDPVCYWTRDIRMYSSSYCHPTTEHGHK